MNGWVYQWKMDYWPNTPWGIETMQAALQSGEESRDHQAQNMTLCVCSPAWHVWVTHWRVCLPFWKLARLFGHLTNHRIILNKQILEKTNLDTKKILKTEVTHNIFTRTVDDPTKVQELETMSEAALRSDCHLGCRTRFLFVMLFSGRSPKQIPWDFFKVYMTHFMTIYVVFQDFVCGRAEKTWHLLCKKRSHETVDWFFSYFFPPKVDCIFCKTADQPSKLFGHSASSLSSCFVRKRLCKRETWWPYASLSNPL